MRKKEMIKKIQELENKVESNEKWIAFPFVISAIALMIFTAWVILVIIEHLATN
jgi:hypothetical protein